MKKIGYMKLNSIKDKADDWIIILDESIGIGQERVLVILAIQESKIDFTRPLKLQDMETVLVKSKESWTSKDVSDELKKIKEKLGTVLYAVADAGNSLKAGLYDAEIHWVYDITHSIAIGLDRIYRNDEMFLRFTSNASKMRGKLCCSKNAHLISPNQRTKSRFLNLEILSNWGSKAIVAHDSDRTSEQEKDQLKWVKEMEPFVMELKKLMEVIQEISIILKNQGFCNKTRSKCLNILKKLKSGRLLKFKKHFLSYLNINYLYFSSGKKKLLCCSDIIESVFGKYKNELGKNPMNGITGLVLIIPALTTTLSEELVLKSLTECSVKDIKIWEKENLCKSLLSKRKKVFDN